MLNTVFAHIPQHLHLIGVGGAGMSGLAQYLLSMERQVSGSDLRRSTDTDRLASLGARIFYEHSAENCAGTDLVVTSDAIPAHNVELQHARRQSMPILRRAQCLDLLSGSKTSVFVAGSHGKSTTSAMIAKVLEASGAAPSFVIGANAPSLDHQKARLGRGYHFIAEACEAFGNLELYNPNIAVITNIDDEHIEHYASQDNLTEAFHNFAVRAGTGGHLLGNGDDSRVRRIFEDIEHPRSTFGFGLHNDISVAFLEFEKMGSRFSVRIDGRVAGIVELRIPGRHAVANALACIATCRALGVDLEHIASGLAMFTGVSRRWEMHDSANGVCIVDDYAHHPTELRAAIDTARSVMDPTQRLVVAFQPQLHSRTRRLYKEFAGSLSGCDHVFLLDVDPGGEPDTGEVSRSLIADEMRKLGRNISSCDDVDHFIDRAQHGIRAGDFLLIAGAGSIRTAVPKLIPRLGRGQDGHARSATSIASLPRALHQWSGRRIVRAIRTKIQSRFGQPSTVIALFRAQVAAQPAGCAVAHAAKNISYGELDQASDTLAAILKARAMGPGAVIGVALRPSVDLIVAMLSVMKLGAAYLPLDENLPGDRVRYMLSKAGARLLVMSEGSRPYIDGLDIQRIYLSNLEEYQSGSSLDGPTIPNKKDPAYICFTSGSTGYPKGIVTKHEALVNLIMDITNRFDVTHKTRTALNTSISFDVSVAEILMTLCGGGRLCISGSRKPLIGDRLADFIDESGITHAAVTPSVLASVPFRSLPTLECIICAGEVCPQELVDTWAEGRRFFNTYGPTETTIYATTAPCQGGQPVTIGKALKHINTYVLDQNLNRVSTGEIGELCLGGIGVASGYIDLPDESQERFVPFALERGRSDRVYKTGDLVSMNTKGELLFAGRRDNQIKIRGNRIELEEVESSVKRIEGVKDAVVGVGEGVNSNELVCFVMADGSGTIDEAIMRDRLSGWLPEYMLPSHFVLVGFIPLTASGKKDRRSLLSQYRHRVFRRDKYAPAISETERKLVSVWKAVLAIDFDIGIHDDFTALGGDSLKSLLAIEELESRMGVRPPPGHFGRFTTIARMAPLVDELSRESTPVIPQSEFFASRIYKQLRDLTSGWIGTRVSDTGLIVSVGGDDPAYHLFWCLQEERELSQLSKYLGDDFRIHGMRSGHLVMDYTQQNVLALATCYLHELDLIRPTGDLLICGTCQGGVIAHAMATNLRKAGRHVPLLILLEEANFPPFEDSVAFFYGEQSFLNPLKRYDTGVARYDEVYKDRYSIDFVPGEHGQLFIEPNVQYLALKVQARILEKLGPPLVS
jgi:UDP-N-acetylmuramate--L-alanine ligase